MSSTVVQPPAKRRRVDDHHYVSAVDDFDASSLTYSQEQSQTARSNALTSTFVRTSTTCSPWAGIPPTWKQDGEALSPISDAINDHNEAIAPNGNTPSCGSRTVRYTINSMESKEDLGMHDESSGQELHNVDESEMCFGMVGGLMTLQSNVAKFFISLSYMVLSYTIQRQLPAQSIGFLFKSTVGTYCRWKVLRPIRYLGWGRFSVHEVSPYLIVSGAKKLYP